MVQTFGNKEFFPLDCRDQIHVGDLVLKPAALQVIVSSILKSSIKKTQTLLFALQRILKAMFSVRRPERGNCSLLWNSGQSGRTPSWMQAFTGP